MNTIQVTVMDYGEFDDLVNDKVYQGDVYDCVADNEWSNDEDHLDEFNQVVYDLDMKEGSYYNTYVKPEIESGKPSGFGHMITYMIEHSILEKGNYLVRVSW